MSPATRSDTGISTHLATWKPLQGPLIRLPGASNLMIANPNPSSRVMSGEVKVSLSERPQCDWMCSSVAISPPQTRTKNDKDGLMKKS